MRVEEIGIVRGRCYRDNEPYLLTQKIIRELRQSCCRRQCGRSICYTDRSRACGLLIHDNREGLMFLRHFFLLHVQRLFLVLLAA